MRLWLRVRRAREVALTILAFGLLLVITTALYLPLPNFFGGGMIAIPVGFILPMIIPVALTWSLTQGSPVLEAVASRPIRHFDTAYLLAAALFAFALCLLAYHVGGNPIALAAGRNVLGYLGLTLIGSRVAGPMSAAMVPAALIMTTSLFGSHATGYPRWWAWPIAPFNRPESWLFALALLILGVAVGLIRSDMRTDDF